MKASSLGAAFSGLILFLAIPSVAQPQSSPEAEAEGACHLPRTQGAPYSAIQETTLSQTLADGTHIESKVATMQIYRDSQGRIRKEFYSRVGPAGSQERILFDITIMDPVECVLYDLHVTNHVAGRRSFSSVATNETPPSSGETSPTVERPQRTIPEDLRPKTSVEQLGTDTIEGLMVEGKRRTTTIPAGARGNDSPMIIISEVWTSPELKIEILGKTSNPRVGENIRRLTNIQRVEPDPDLFRVPTDYKIQEEYD